MHSMWIWLVSIPSHVHPTYASVVSNPATSSSHLFAYEEVKLDHTALPDIFTPGNTIFSFTDGENEDRVCKVFSGDSDWPSLDQWHQLYQLSKGGLLQLRSAASVCYNDTAAYNTAACSALTEKWVELSWHTDDPLEMLSPFYEGNTCLLPSVYDSGNCTQGGYSAYVMNTTSVRDIQLAVNFARNTGIRLVIKNTGHDFNGKSGGAGSLSIWLHHLQDLRYIEDYASHSYTGPAIKAGAGVQVRELYKFANRHGHVAVGGDCSTVGVVGGYIQGGGHSPLSPLFGMAADQALAFEVVLANGTFVSANEIENSDLFRALRGGGGGTFGVVTSAILKVYPDIQVSTANLTFSTATEGVTKHSLWQGIKSFLSYFPQWTDDGLYVFFFLWANTPSPDETMFEVVPFFAPNKSLDGLRNTLNSWLSDLKRLNISATPIFDHYETFYSAWQVTHQEVMQPPNQAVASRLWPRANFQVLGLFDDIFYAIQANFEAGYKTFGYSISPRGVDVPENAVNPAWRNTVSHVMSALNWPLYASSEEIMDAWDKFEGYMNKWRAFTPDSGAYINEADRLEPNWQQSFWGEHYPRLLSIKHKYDPHNLFWAHHAVGSEGWEVRSVDDLPNENGRLCKT